VLVTGTLPRRCAETTCAGFGAGIGIAVLDGAEASLARFASTDNALAGLQIATLGTLDAENGRVAGNLVGANVQTEGFDLARITRRVVYDNEQNLDASALPVPSLSE
jgi:hypothetical protein